MNIFEGALLTLFPALMIIAALTDVTSFTIPNRIPILLALAYLFAALALRRPLAEIGVHLAIGAAALAMAMGAFAAGWIGGGDGKLFAAAALWLGWPAAPTFLIYTSLFGGGLAFLLLNARSDSLRPMFAGAPTWLERLATPGQAVPYGVAIACGGLAAFPGSTLMHAFQGSF